MQDRPRTPDAQRGMSARGHQQSNELNSGSSKCLFAVMRKTGGQCGAAMALNYRRRETELPGAMVAYGEFASRAVQTKGLAKKSLPGR